MRGNLCRSEARAAFNFPTADDDKRMAIHVICGIEFDIARSPTGWFGLITFPNGARVEIHDFETEAGVKAWIRVNARDLALNYLNYR
ncbi:MAG: hypothetical protein U1E25_14005 [Methylocystis sp.]